MNPAACAPVITDAQVIAHTLETLGLLAFAALMFWVTFK